MGKPQQLRQLSFFNIYRIDIPILGNIGNCRCIMLMIHLKLQLIATCNTMQPTNRLTNNNPINLIQMNDFILHIK
ncbi:hypothetical protein D3C77_321410 [compost metagenome]